MFVLYDYNISIEPDLNWCKSQKVSVLAAK